MTLSIATNPNHMIHPFTWKEGLEKLHLTTYQKVCGIALFILCALTTLFILGIFFLATAHWKNKKVTEMHIRQIREVDSRAF